MGLGCGTAEIPFPPSVSPPPRRHARMFLGIFVCRVTINLPINSTTNRGRYVLAINVLALCSKAPAVCVTPIKQAIFVIYILIAAIITRRSSANLPEASFTFRPMPISRCIARGVQREDRGYENDKRRRHMIRCVKNRILIERLSCSFSRFPFHLSRFISARSTIVLL